MKFTFGQLVSLAIAVGLAAVLIYVVPFEASAAVPAASSQVVYAPIFEPPVISGEPGRIDVPLLLLELVFVAFVGGAVFIGVSQKKKGS